jgi:hypothetical protein
MFGSLDSSSRAGDGERTVTFGRISGDGAGRTGGGLVADFTVALKEEMERGMERFGGKNQKMLCGRKWLSSLDFNTGFQNISLSFLTNKKNDTLPRQQKWTNAGRRMILTLTLHNTKTQWSGVHMTDRITHKEFSE